MTRVSPPIGPKNILSPEFLKTIAQKPGVYLMEDGLGRVIYVGKARNLRKRLASYSRAKAGRYDKTAVLIAKLRDLSVIITNTEKEALILEASLIKKHKPKYNIILRDDKNYPLIKVTVNEDWPRVVVVRRRLHDRARYFGPFSSASALRHTLNFLNSQFPLRRCRDRQLKKRSRPCLNFQIGRCSAPCTGQADRQNYMASVHNVLLVLEGRGQQLIRDLEKDMQEASLRLDFEAAALSRDRIKALASTLEKQIVFSQIQKDIDVYGFARQEKSVAVSILLVRHGRVSGQRIFYLDGPVGSDPEILTEVLKRYYDEDPGIPREIFLPFALEDKGLLAEWLSDILGKKVSLKIPRRGDRLKLLGLARTNARQIHVRHREKRQGWENTASAISRTLHLARVPDRIECLDISNIGGEAAVGALVCFMQGEKKKSAYRHYKIRSVAGADDYAMMAEVLRRRLGKDLPVDDLPDLLLLDGGKGQLNVGVRILADLGLTGRVDLASIAKGHPRKGSREKLFRPGRKNPVVPASHSPVLLFLMRIRDEAHRFGIEFHRRWRKKINLASPLDAVPGIGPAKKIAMLSTLGSLRKIKTAEVGELAVVPGIGPKLAEQIWSHFHGKAKS